MNKTDGEDHELLELLASGVANRRMCAPAIFVLESSKPLSFVASQALLVFEPIIHGVLGVKNYPKFISLLEDRENVEWLIRRLEELENEPRSHPDDTVKK